MEISFFNFSEPQFQKHFVHNSTMKIRFLTSLSPIGKVKLNYLPHKLLSEKKYRL